MIGKKIVLITALFITTITSASAQEPLSGDAGLACEAILCLSTGTRPNECLPSLRRYFSISYRLLSDTIQGRFNFLKLCPIVGGDANMSNLVDAIAHGAGRCDAPALNASQMVWQGDSYYISNSLPNYCAVYTNRGSVHIAAKSAT